MADDDRGSLTEPGDERTFTAVPRLSARQGRREAFLLALSGPQFGEIFPLEQGRELVLGRREDADVVIRDDGVSRRHAVVRVEGGRATLRDEGSANGTWVDGRRIAEVPLEDGARIALGAFTALKFTWADELEARWQARLAERAIQDPLTGLYNRRHLEERLGAELAAASRHGRTLTVLLADADAFKAVNDTHGHLAGDEVLKMLAFVLRGAIRREDVLARFGGEEFAVVARETGLSGGKALAERMRRAVERSRCAWQGLDLAVTVSVGVATYAPPTPYEPGETDRALLEAADRALYLAKQAGRNTVVGVGR